MNIIGITEKNSRHNESSSIDSKKKQKTNKQNKGTFGLKKVLDKQSRLSC